MIFPLLRKAIIILTLLLLSACEKDEPVPDVHISERTVLVWLAGDNNLYSEVPHKLSALAEGFRNASPSDCRLLVYADRRGNYPQLIEILPDGNQSVLETYPAQNSASPETFSRFLNYMIETAPARHYGLILFSHATGWLPQGALENPSLEEKPLSRTVFDDNGEQMTLAELSDALPADIRFDYIVFENCFMGGARKWHTPSATRQTGCLYPPPKSSRPASRKYIPRRSTAFSLRLPTSPASPPTISTTATPNPATIAPPPSA